MGLGKENIIQMDLRQNLSFGFETTWSIPEWWMDSGFCSAWESPKKIELMNTVAHRLARNWGVAEPVLKLDDHGSTEWEIYNHNKELLYRVVAEPGTIEINTPPVLIGELERSLTPLFQAAEASGLVPYRSWWYGWQSGTMGGCHINMGGLSRQTNAWITDPLLVLKYFAYMHNRPWLHYPFMGPDIGSGGNCMRMDEDPTRSSLERFQQIKNKIDSGWIPEIDEIHEFFVGTTLRTVKHSSPTLRKVKLPDCLIEDRAVEMVKTPQELMALCELRMRILEKLQKQSHIEDLLDFGESLHREFLSELYLQHKLEQELLSLGLSLKNYQSFLDRQFPLLNRGDSVPRQIQIREGRRERVITGVQESVGEMVLSKTIDARYKRFEFHINQVTCAQQGVYLRVNGHEFEPGAYGVLLDVFAPYANDTQAQVLLNLELLNEKGELLEKACFDPNAMMFKSVDFKPHSLKTKNRASSGYYNLESQRDFLIL